MTIHADRLIPLAPLLGLLVLAATLDLRSRRIPNWLTVSLMLSGLLFSLLGWSPIGPVHSFIGLLVGFALPFVLFAIGALGGGDVKLLAGIGAWLGPVGVLAVFLLECVVGLVIVTAQALIQGRLAALLRNSTVLVLSMRHVGDLGADHLRATGLSARSIDRPLPYAVPVLVAVILVILVL
jgi:prepilin peptidase CpaA